MKGSCSFDRGRRWEAYWMGVLTGRQRGFRAQVLRGLLQGAAGLYRGGVEAHLGLYRWGLIPRTRLPCQVVSVGNLTLGGTGKTSCVLWLARQYRAQGQRVALLSRGHGRQSREAVGVVADGRRVCMEATQAGDEPYLLASLLQDIPVLVGKNRVRTGCYAVQHFGSEVLILDDGFQYWRLVKDVEIALVDATNPFGPGALFPAGTLREPRSHLNRADLIWITRSECVTPGEIESLRAELSREYPTIPLQCTAHEPIYVRTLNAAAKHPPSRLQGQRLLALSSIGNPGAFEKNLHRLGVAELVPARFPDHYPYRPEDLEEITQVVRQRGLEGIVTTEKDATRLPAQWDAGRPIWVLGIDLRLSPDAALAARLGLKTPNH